MKASLLLFTFLAVLAFIAIHSDATVIRYVHAVAGAPAVSARGFFQDVTVSYRDVSDYSYAVPDTRIKLTDNAGIPLGSFVIGNASEYTAVIRGSLSDMASIGVTLFVDSFQPLKGGVSFTRLVHAAYGAPAVDLIVEGNRIFRNATYLGDNGYSSSIIDSQTATLIKSFENGSVFVGQENLAYSQQYRSTVFVLGDASNLAQYPVNLIFAQDFDDSNR